MSEVLLKVENLKTYFSITKGKVKAVDGVSFTLNKGESIGLVGESGCGKTTTALSVIRLLPKEGNIESGKIIFEGNDITNLEEEKLSDFRWKEVSMIFQGAMNALNPVKRVCDQIAEPILLHEKISKTQAMKRVKELFELVELDTNLMYSYPHEFSGGMRQRAIIAMALACNPKLIIGDEPTTALDVMVQAQILDLINDLRKKLNTSMIMITHDLSIITETCDKIAIMYAGKIVELGETEEVVTNSLHPYTKKLISAFPNIYGERKMVDSIPGDPPNLYNPPVGCRFSERCHMMDNRICVLSEDPPLIDYTGNYHFVASFKEEFIMSRDAKNIVEVKNLEVNFKIKQGFYEEYIKREKKVVRAVDKISFNIEKGEIVSLVGESGSGKTSTGRALLQLAPTTSGEIIFDSENINIKDKEYMKNFRKRAQMIFQDPYQSLNPRFTVFDIVTEPLIFTKNKTSMAEKEIFALKALEFAGLRPAAEYLYRYPHELSGGQRQRVSIATCFIMSPDFIVADEPVSMLDASVRADILKLFVSMKEQQGTSFLFITHDLALAWLISNRVAIMYLGKIMESGPADIIAEGCLHPYSQALTSVLAMVGEKKKMKRIVLKDETPSALNVPKGCRFHTRCPVSRPDCIEVEPEYREINPGHFIYCHYPQKII